MATPSKLPAPAGWVRPEAQRDPAGITPQSPKSPPRQVNQPPPRSPREAMGWRGGRLQDKRLVPHRVERLAYDLCAMDLVFGDEVLDHCFQPLLAVGVGRLLALGLDAQQAVRVAEACKGPAVQAPCEQQPSPFGLSHPLPAPLTADVFPQNPLGFLHGCFQTKSWALKESKDCST